VLKAVRGGYDGRGVWMLRSPQPELVAELLAAGTPLLVEQAVPMRRELAALVARSPYGQAAAWPVVETVQEDGQCVQVLAPAPGLDEQVAAGAQEMALRIAAELKVTGLLAVEHQPDFGNLRGGHGERADTQRVDQPQGHSRGQEREQGYLRGTRSSEGGNRRRVQARHAVVGPPEDILSINTPQQLEEVSRILKSRLDLMERATS
jgi:hypothetical protein